MSQTPQDTMLNKLLLQSQQKGRLWAALAALFTGTTLLLLAVMIWWNFQELLYGKHQDDSLGSTFLTIGKKVTNENMGKPQATVFTPGEIEALKQAPQVQEIGIISSNHFPVYAVMGGSMAFATDLPLESVPDSFIDHLPKDWKWQPGSVDLPIIISTQFLDIYNYVFAPSQGLPQLSQSSVKSIAMQLKAGREGANETFLAHVVGFSDRINSVMAPQSFIDYGNNKYGKPGLATAPSQLILKTRDPSDTKFASYIEGHNYTTNAQNLRWSKVRAIVEVISTATGVLAILLMGIGTLVFVLFIELTVARAQQSITLLMQIGYSPRLLSRFMSGRFLPLVLITVFVSVITACAAQVVASVLVKDQGLQLPYVPGWPVWAALVVSTTILVFLISRSVRVAISKG